MFLLKNNIVEMYPLTCSDDHTLLDEKSRLKSLRLYPVFVKHFNVAKRQGGRYLHVNSNYLHLGQLLVIFLVIFILFFFLKIMNMYYMIEGNYLKI